MEKVTVQELVSKNSDRLKYERRRGESAVWNSFSTIVLEGNLVDFVKCMKCSTVLKWKSRDWTSGLRTHIQCCSPKVAHTRCLTDMPSISTVVKQSLPASVKREVADTLVQMCATEYRYQVCVTTFLLQRMASSRQAVVHVVQLQFIVRLLWLGMKPKKTSKYGVAIFWLNPF